MHFDGRDVSYGEVLEEATALAQRLRGHYGISSGERVALLLPTSPQWLVAFIAVTSIGAVAVLIGERRPAAESARALDLTSCSLVLADEVTARMLTEHGDRRPCLLVGNFAGSTPGALSDGHLPFDPQVIDPEQEALIALTTGSTSSPKAVISSHRAVIAGMMNMMLASALAAARNRPKRAPAQRAQTAPAALLLAPLTHVGGYSHLLLMMQVAGKIVPLPTWQVEKAVELIRTQNIRALSGANSDQLRELLRTAGANRALSSLTSVGIHGEALRDNILAELREQMPNATAVTGYGLTETNGSICAASGDDLIEHPGTCGPFVPSVEARILDDHGTEVPNGGTGEIWVRGAMLLSGYCCAPGAAASGPGDGWFRTEDFGRLDRDGFVYLQQRRQDIFYCDGKPLSVATIERVVYECDGVDEAAALNIGSGSGMTRIVVAIVLRTEAEDGRRRVVTKLAREVAAAKCEVVVLEGLPRLPSGKIDRRALRERFTR